MVSEFKIARIPNIYFGVGNIKLLPDLLKQYKGSVLFIISKSLATCSAQIRQVESITSMSGKDIERAYSHGEPTANSIDEIVNSCRNKNIGVVCGIGGGSVIDTSKAVSAMLKEKDSVEHYLEGIGSKTVSGSRANLIAVPTTAGTGSEATKNAVVSKIGIAGYKCSLRHDNYIPDIAIIDPELSLSCPANITAASGMDAFTQLLESLISSNSNPFTDALAMKGLTAIKNSLLTSYIDGTDISARSDMAFAAMVSGITLANAGLGLVHGFAASIAGYFEIPHGIICGTLLAEVYKANVCALIGQKNHKDKIEKFALLAKLFFPQSKLSGYDLLMNFSDLLFEWTNILHIPGLGKYGVNATDLEKIIKITEHKNNPIKLSESVLMQILLSRI